MTQKNKHRTTKRSPSVLPTREVNILFNGLFFFAFDDGPETGPDPHKRAKCTVGILSTRQEPNKDHSLFVRFSEGGCASEAIEIPHSVLSNLPEAIEVTREGLAAGTRDVTIRGFNGRLGWGVHPDRHDPSVDADHFDWIIDFETLHTCNLAETPGSLRPKLLFKTGDFHTAQVSEKSYTIRQESSSRPFGYVAALIGARIVLSEGEKLVFQVNGVRYPLPTSITKIYLDNVRPSHLRRIPCITERQHSGTDVGIAYDHQGHAHEGHAVSPKTDDGNDDTQIYYYDLLQGVPPCQRCHFAPVNSEGLVPHTPPFICYGSGGSRN